LMPGEPGLASQISCLSFRRNKKSKRPRFTRRVAVPVSWRAFGDLPAFAKRDALRRQPTPALHRHGRVRVEISVPEATTPVRPCPRAGRTGVVASIWHLAGAVQASCGRRDSFWSGKAPVRSCAALTGVASSHEAEPGLSPLTSLKKEREKGRKTKLFTLHITKVTMD
jgi:hypothetical protein